VAAVEELKRLAITTIARNVVSMDAGSDLETLLAGFKAVTAGFSGLPLPIPGTTFARAIAARDAIFAILRRVVAEHRERPHDDGLGRMLASRGPVHDGGSAPKPPGEAISDEDATKELHHVFIAGYIVFAELAAILIRLVERPDLHAALAAEVLAHAPAGPLG